MSDLPSGLSGCQILLVEDSLTQALQLQYVLSQKGHEVTLARNGREALEMLQFLRPTLIISDIVMPLMDGYELCAAVKENPETRSIPVVLLTSLGDPEDIVRGLRANADCYLTKPYNVNYLVATIETLLANPYSAIDDTAEELEVTVAGRAYSVKANRRQMLNLLLSIYGGAVQRNQELEDAQIKLRDALDRLEENSAQLQNANLQLQDQVTQDGLTGVRNRRAFNERIEEEMARAVRQNECLSLLLVDIDHFKQLNDTYGHLEGDEVLKQFAELMTAVSRQGDFVARYGGEEFAAILPNTNGSGSCVWGERLRETVLKETAKRRGFTVSVGIATLEGSGPPVRATEFINLADKALYKAKKTGRNRVVHADELDA